MPVSIENGKQYIRDFVATVSHSKMLDIGCGCGTYAQLFPNADWTGVEAWEPYVSEFGLNDLYNNLIIQDARTVDYNGKYDIAFAGDVLEHMPSEDAAKLLLKLRSVADYTIVSIPLGHHPQGAVNGNEYERHIEDWDHAKVCRVFGLADKAHIDGIIGVYIYKRIECKIPKKIHIVWIGDESQRPDKYIQSWIDMNPGWEIKVWGNIDFTGRKWVNISHMSTMWDAGSLHGVADLMRYEILWEEGGFCIDADSECIKPLDDHLFDSDIVLTYENTKTRPGLISVGYMAAAPKQVFFFNIIGDIKTSEKVDTDHAWHSVGPRRLTDCYDKFKPARVKILPDYTFIPDHFDAPSYNGNGDVYAKQHWFTTKKQNKKLKICVYAISKNEGKFVERFCEAAKDADLILIADTGSTDNTVEQAHKHGAIVHNICITPWRFDHARNAAISLIPRDVDVCVSLDLDEILQPGWREDIERVWEKGKTTRLRYMFDWGCGIAFYYEKIHARHGYFWHHPCHEYPTPDGRIQEVWAQTDKLLVIHKPDPTKSRGQYLDLLKLSVEEDPQCPRNAFYYARELSFHAQWNESIKECNRYLNLPRATWHNERCYAYRTMGRCYNELGDLAASEKAYHQAAAEAPNTREPWCELALLMYRQARWAECLAYSMRALEIKNREAVYTVDPAVWGHYAHDLASISAWNMGLKELALEQAKIALEHTPQDTRLQNNLKLIELSMQAA